MEVREWLHRIELIDLINGIGVKCAIKEGVKLGCGQKEDDISEHSLSALLHSTTWDCRKPPTPKRFMAATRNTYSVPSTSLVNLKQGLVTDSEMVVQPGRWASRCSTTYPLTFAPPSFSGGSQLTATDTPVTSSIFTGPTGMSGLSVHKGRGLRISVALIDIEFLSLNIFKYVLLTKNDDLDDFCCRADSILHLQGVVTCVIDGGITDDKV